MKLNRHTGIVFLFICLFVSTIISAATLNFQVYIDGSSELHIQGSDVYWQHYQYSAPGWRNDSYTPTVINGNDWYPWPDSAGSNYGCGGCISPVHAQLTPPLSITDQTLSLNVISGRGSVNITQHPSSANDYTAVISIDDDSFGGDDFYEIEVTYEEGELTPIPTLSEWGMIIMAALVAGAALLFLSFTGAGA